MKAKIKMMKNKLNLELLNLKQNEKKNFFLIAFLVIGICSFFTRFYELGLKPIHSDESVNGWFVIQIWETGFFKYDPTNYHGPFYFYLLQFWETLFGYSVESLRGVAAFFSASTVMLFLHKRWIRNFFLAALFILISPTMIFYGRSGIHESTFVFFQTLTLLGFWLWQEEKEIDGFYWLIFSIVIMFTLKETAAIHLLSFGISYLFLYKIREIKNHFNEIKGTKLSSFHLNLMIIAGFIFLFSFSGGFRNLQGLLDFFKAFMPWFKTGVSESGHNKEFLYWFKMILMDEPLLFFSMLIGLISLFLKRPKVEKFIFIGSLIQFLIYSWIPYKTPWCIISMIAGFYMVSALQINSLFMKAKSGIKWSVLFIVFSLVSWKAPSTLKLNFQSPFWMDHPFVYVNSTNELKMVTDKIIKFYKNHPELYDDVAQVAASETWPFPWLFHQLFKINYTKLQSQIEKNSVIFIIDDFEAERLKKEIDSTLYEIIQFQNRQSGPVLQIWILKSRFQLMGQTVRNYGASTC